MRIEATFKAIDEDDNEYTIYVMRDEHPIVEHGGRHTMSPDGLAEMRTDDGRFVNFVGPGVYEIVDGTDVIRVTSSDPKAPQD